GPLWHAKSASNRMPVMRTHRPGSDVTAASEPGRYCASYAPMVVASGQPGSRAAAGFLERDTMMVGRAQILAWSLGGTLLASTVSSLASGPEHRATMSSMPQVANHVSPQQAPPLQCPANDGQGTRAPSRASNAAVRGRNLAQGAVREIRTRASI